MSENTNDRDGFTARLTSDMPPVPDDSALRRVYARVRRETERPAPARRATRAWRLAGVIAATAAALAVGAYVLAPSLDTAAFAREQAADALLLPADGRVLHAVVHFTDRAENDREGHDPRLDLDQRWESWVDLKGRRIREDYTNVSDGSLDNRSVRQGDHVAIFQNNVRYLTGAKQQLIDEATTRQPFGSGIGGMIDYLRARISDGSATVSGSRTIDGDEYWVVEWTSDEKDIHIVATLRTSDYRLKTWTQEVKTASGDGSGLQRSSAIFETYEVLQPNELPTDFFSFEQVFSAAEPGTRVEKR